ncbi:NAD-dependent epimerase/dehydratase family protein [Streptococcus sp. zg-JUN1979]|uniref:NAD-dependent epimerase/dehydratase family protein n=1 Tax=Streptococcus sp. zg-JUN1979 TaxID=3391450 RepID=UPI0039A641CA
MTKVVLLGGNGYIGRQVMREWLKRDDKLICYVVARSEAKEAFDARVHYIQADVADVVLLKEALPDRVDYIVDFVGRPEANPKRFRELNDLPAQTMLELAQLKQAKAMGFIGGRLGPKSFIQGKKRIIEALSTSGIRLEVVEPTIVYGEDRKDLMAKLVPLLQVLGRVFKSVSPVYVGDVAQELVDKLIG